MIVQQRKIRVRDRGSITIPFKFRRELNINDSDEILNATILGENNKLLILSKTDDENKAFLNKLILLLEKDEFNMKKG